MKSDLPSSPMDRRSFLRGIGTSAVVVAAGSASALASAQTEVPKPPESAPAGPGTVAITLTINGAQKDFQLEPRVTLLDALRNHSPLTGTKEVCDRGTCGACTVLVDGKPIYSCMKLAIDAQGKSITTIEGLALDGKPTALQQAFVDCDALMCGFCTPGMVLAATSLLADHPQPSEEEIRRGCSGNLCRCGAYPHIIHAVLKASGQAVPESLTVLNYDQLA